MTDIGKQTDRDLKLADSRQCNAASAAAAVSLPAKQRTLRDRTNYNLHCSPAAADMTERHLPPPRIPTSPYLTLTLPNSKS